MTFQIIVHADDFGITREMTDRIFKACDANVLSSISIVPNGLAFEYAIQEFKKRSHLRLAIHLNLSEGYPVSNKSEINYIINKKGRFI